MKVLKEIISLLQPFQQATDELQGDFETVGGVIPAFLDIKTKLTQISDLTVNGSFPSPIVYCKKIAESLRTSMVSRLSYVLNDTYYVLGTYISIYTYHNTFS